MMGSNDKPQEQFFYSFNLDEIVPQDHLLRSIDHYLDLSDLRQHLAPYYSHTGRPSVDPELMIRMLLIGYCLVDTDAGITKANTISYRASKFDCEACPFKQRCCPNTPYCKVSRSVYEAARDVARAVAKTPAYRTSRRQRKQVEMLFAHIKRVLKMDRVRLRGLSGAQDEFLLTATAQNLRRMANSLSTGPPVACGMA